MLVDVVDAVPHDGTWLDLRFGDQRTGSVDVGRLVQFEGVFAPLADPVYFARVRVDPELGTVVWPNGADLDPQVLYAAAASRS